MDKIASRITKVLEYYNMNAGTFADKIGVQRSGLSHILTGRNKPSLDFVIKITEAFDTVDLNWLIHGLGTFPKSAAPDAVKIPAAPQPKITSETTLPLPKKSLEIKTETIANQVSKIMLFYADGTFEEFSPR